MIVVVFGFFFVLYRSLINDNSHWPTNVALFTLISDLSWRQFFIHTPIIVDQYMRIFERCLFSSSFGRQSSQTCGYAGWEPYVRTHITELPCLQLNSKPSKIINLKKLSIMKTNEIFAFQEF